MRKRLSIVVPVFNAEKHLKSNLMTIISQLTPSCELIIVDDGSTDHSGHICDQLKEQFKDIVVVHQVNSGVSNARNTGIEKATGQYITFVDSDDYLSKEYVHSILSFLDTNDVDLVFLGATGCKKTRKYDLKPWLRTDDRSQLKDSSYARHLVFGCKSNEVWDKVFYRKIINDFNIRFPDSVSLGEDLLFSIDYIKHVNSVGICSKSIYNHTMYKEGLGRQQNNHDAIRYYDILFHKMLASAKESDDKYEACSTILQILTNYVGKLAKNGMSKKDISTLLNSFNWYLEIIDARYKGFKMCLRKWILRLKLYHIAAIVFSCDD